MSAVMQRLSLAYRQCYERRAAAVKRFERSYANSYSKYKLQRISKLEYDQRVRNATLLRDQALHNAITTYEKAKGDYEKSNGI